MGDSAQTQAEFIICKYFLTLQGAWTGLAFNFVPSAKDLRFAGLNPALYA